MMRDHPFDFAAGEVLLIDKPLGWTSFDVVKKIRNAIKIKKVGHAGTLDPLATGLLIVCTGKKTKEINHYQGQSKEYECTFCMGKTTPSHDLETEIDQEKPIDHLTTESLESATEQFVGDIWQVPPQHSAVKVGGKRAYSMARAGKEVKIDPKSINISQFDIIDVNLPEVRFVVHCSKGTYIRSLARDYGKALDVGAHLTSLRRTSIGDRNVQDAWQLEDLIKEINKQREGIS